jgi:hypothetical protein
VATPALLPDGSVAEESLFDIIESTARERLDEDVHSIADAGSDLGARALRGPVPPVGSDQEISMPPADADESSEPEDSQESSDQEGSEVQR